MMFWVGFIVGTITICMNRKCSCVTGPSGQDWGGRPCDSCGGSR